MSEWYLEKEARDDFTGNEMRLKVVVDTLGDEGPQMIVQIGECEICLSHADGQNFPRLLPMPPVI